MKELHIPGAVFILVKDGEIFFAKGYGFANLEKKTPVIPDKTLFRVGSVSKLFTTTAIMQLYEKEMLNLDDDVNKYLRNFQLEDNYPQSVTIANLLTHTGGFDERLTGMAARSPSEVLRLENTWQIICHPACCHQAM
ncbi:MAG: serine hydrolase domain-containing protein [Candidatus Methanofastidiosia archaeon]